ncbi:hypothetical protein [Cupriavidus necator]|uniref:hypothetical protein n=1 Tax=Cupriavidus necator TaxID=106590 RepID=UPI0007C83CA4|nr:hypothetical protein [Cupriavidus necator]
MGVFLPDDLVQQCQRLPSGNGDYLEQALDLRRASHARWLGVEPPFDGGVFVWNGTRYYHVGGIDTTRHKVLIEVFRINAEDKLEAVLAFQYPPPIRDLYPAEYQLLYKDDPWDGAFPPSGKE